MELNNKNQRPKILVHCKSCRGVVIKNFNAEKMEGEIEFNLRCPHCAQDCKVVVKSKKLISTLIE